MTSPTTWSPIATVGLSGNNALDSLLIGAKWTSGAIGYSFATNSSVWSTDPTTGYGLPSDGQEPYQGYDTFTFVEQIFTRQALTSWSNVANLNFTEVADNAITVGDIRFAFSDLVFEAQAWAYAPDEAAYAGDVWVNTTSTSHDFQWTPGSYEFLTIVHELGHALGLDHPFTELDKLGPPLPQDQDYLWNTVMSYSAWPGPGTDNYYLNFYPTTPMALDIGAMQYLYGANTNYHSGDDTYVFSQGNHYLQTIWDAGGIDTIKYTATSSGCVIDLDPGSWSQLGTGVGIYKYNPVNGRSTFVGTERDTVNIFETVIIENAIGSNFNDLIHGNDVNNSLGGGGGNDSLTGGLGNDTLNGGAGIDSLVGGDGDDTYIVDNAADKIVELVNQGIDTALSSVTYSLVDTDGTGTNGGNVENLTLTGTGNISATGNTLNNILIGNTGINVLTGGLGDDSLDGGAGGDIYFVASATEHTQAEFNDTGLTGTDEVRFGAANTSGGATLTLFAGDTGIERVTIGTGAAVAAVTTGTAALNIDASAVQNALTITGNSGINILTGTDFNDTLNGGLGNDSMNGGDGDDIYVMSAITDAIQDSSGNDTVQAAFTLSLDNLIFGGQIENLALLGTAAINATGNALNNLLIGNAGANIIDGGTGTDSMDGGKGSDTYVVDNLGDTVIESFTSAQSGGIDLVKSSVNFTLGDNLDNLTLTGIGDIYGTGNALKNTITGNAGSNILDGGAGVDVLVGGLGNDTYLVDLVQTGTTASAFRVALQDTVTETSSGGNDSLILRGNFNHLNATTLTLATTLENLDASQTGTTKLNLTGNASANRLIGNAGNNILIGAAGNDTLDGGEGNDLYLISSAAEHTQHEFTDTGIAGIDEVRFAAATAGSTLTLFADDAGIERVTIGTGVAATAISTGTLALNVDTSAAQNALAITGNAGANILTGTGFGDTIIGGAGNDSLIGGLGNDSLDGGAGNDTYVVDSTSDIVTESLVGVAGGVDLVKSSANFTLGNNLENLTLTGSDNINGTGNSLNNIIIGNTGNNELNGDAGNDTLIGDSGNDILNGGVGNDTLTGGAGIDTFVFSGAFNATTNIDTITDFVHGTDVISVDSVIPAGGIGITNFSFGAGLTVSDGAEVYIIYDTTTGTLYYDSDGFTGAAAIAFAKLTTKPTLSFSDFREAAITNNGTSGNDYLVGGAGYDTLNGGAGDDTLNGGAGNNKLDGGIGIDTVTYIGATSYVSVDMMSYLPLMLGDHDPNGVDQLTNIENIIGSQFSDMVRGSEVNNRIEGLAGDDYIFGGDGDDQLYGGTDGDVLEGAADNDQLYGGAGSDWLSGGDGNDTLAGDDGNDTLVGGLSADILTGGDGLDTFLYSLISESSIADGWDTVTDFMDGDKIDLSGIDANTLIAGDQAFDFIGVDVAFSNVAGQLRFNSLTHILSGDVSGNGLSDFDIGLTGVTSLTGSNFKL